MRVSQVLQTDCVRIDAYCGTDAARLLFDSFPALVVTENGEFIGLLTEQDLARNPRVIVKDSVRPKPSVQLYAYVGDVYCLLRECGLPALPVVNRGKFKGIVTRDAIIDQLLRTMREEQEQIFGVMHDLKAPVANISALTSLLEKSPADMETIIRHTKKSCDHLSALISSIARQQGMVWEESCTTVELCEFLTDVLESMHGMAQAKGVRLESEYSPSRSTLNIRPIELQRAVQNLLSNAIKFTPPGGMVRLSAADSKTSTLITIFDTGIGIPDEIQTSVFQKYSPGIRPGTNGEQSTGLGTFIAQRIIKEHNGTVWFESKPGEGTTFYIKLER